MEQLTLSRIGYLFTSEALAALCSLMGLKKVLDIPAQQDDGARERGLLWLEDAGYATPFGDRHIVGETIAYILHALDGQQPLLKLEGGGYAIQVYGQDGIRFLVDDAVRGRIRIMPLPSAEEAASELTERLAAHLPLTILMQPAAQTDWKEQQIDNVDQARALLLSALR